MIPPAYSGKLMWYIAQIRHNKTTSPSWGLMQSRPNSRKKKLPDGSWIKTVRDVSDAGRAQAPQA